MSLLFTSLPLLPLLTNDESYVLATLALTMFSSTWHGMRIGRFRKAAGPVVTYPTPYADSTILSNAKGDDAKLALHRFNCAQRAHGNFLENSTTAMLGMLVAGVKYPISTAVLGLGWNLARIAYATGYTNSPLGSGKGRLRGSSFWAFQLGLVLLTGATGASLLGWF